MSEIIDDDLGNKKQTRAFTKYLKLGFENGEAHELLKGKHVTFLYYGKDYPTDNVVETIDKLHVDISSNCGWLKPKEYKTDFGPNKDLCVITYTPSENLLCLRNKFYESQPKEIQDQNFADWVPHITFKEVQEESDIKEVFDQLSKLPLLVTGIECSNGNLCF
jgi:hypothetical protein